MAFLSNILSLVPILTTLAFEVPCSQKLIGSSCQFDEECYGQNTICRSGRCSCPTNFEEFDVDEKTTVCRQAPSRIGDTCQRDCRPPLLCRDGRCECWGGSIVDGQCIVPCPPGQQLYGVECTRIARWGQACEKDSHCVDPFTACLAGTCQCAPGAQRDVMRGFCYAVCPDGTHPSQTCRRLFVNDIDMVENAAQTDSCPSGQRCVTYGAPYVGHCCRLKCPYGDADLSQSCDAGAAPDVRCRPLTHFCYKIAEPGWRASLCCPRPCRDPTPLYINGQCMSIAHRDDPCQIDQQCEGGVAMACLLGSCQCRAGYHSMNEERFPTCEKTCLADQVPSGDRCLKRVTIGERCLSSRQCPDRAECRAGVCTCQCGFKLTKDSLLGLRCTDPQDPFQIGRILENVGEIFGRGAVASAGARRERA